MMMCMCVVFFRPVDARHKWHCAALPVYLVQVPATDRGVPPDTDARKA